MLTNCRVCGGASLSLFYTQGAAGEYRFYRCEHCRLVNYDLSGGMNQEKYATKQIDPHDTTQRSNLLQTETQRFLQRRAGPAGRLLEVGCGNGLLLHLSRADGWEVKGLELSDSLATAVRREFGIDVVTRDFLEYEDDDHFDVVVLRHVLEHLADPVAAMHKVHGLLKPGGRALLEFPNIDALDRNIRRLLDRAGLHKKRYRIDYKPGHYHVFCREAFRFLAERTGFELMVWETYSSKRLLSHFYRRVPIGNKARALVRKISG